MQRTVLTIVNLAILTGAPSAFSQIIVIDSFNPAEVGTIVGVGFDATNDTVWVYGAFDGETHYYTRDGTYLNSISWPGEAANDADLEFAVEPIMLDATPIPAGTLLVTNGETSAAEIYAVDKSTGTVLATLNTAFGLSHVVGGAFHGDRDTMFLVQDRVPSGTGNDNVIAEVSLSNGSVLNTFKIDDFLPGYSVNYGDVEVDSGTGNLLIVSSDESSIAEFTPSGGLVQTIELPSGVSSLSGIAIDEARDEIWLTSSSGNVFRVGTTRPGDIDGDGDIDVTDFARFAPCLAGPDVLSPPPGCDIDDFAASDIDGDKDVDMTDFARFQVGFGT